MKKMIWAGLLSTVTALGAAVGAQGQTSVPFALDWKFEGPSAAYFAAIDNGHFAAGGLEVWTDAPSEAAQSAALWPLALPVMG